MRFNAEGLEGLIDHKALGNGRSRARRSGVHWPRWWRSGRLRQREAVRLRPKDVAKWIFEAFGITVDEATVGRELKAMGFRRLSAPPPHHAQNEFPLETQKLPGGAGSGPRRFPGRNAD